MSMHWVAAKSTIMIFLLSLASVCHSEVAVYTEAKTAVTVSADHNEFVIKLKANPTTGYSWFLRDYDIKLIQAVKHEFEAPQDKKLMGASGYEVWTFKVKPVAFIVPQITIMRFTYQRPWEPDEASHQVTFRVSTQ